MMSKIVGLLFIQRSQQIFSTPAKKKKKKRKKKKEKKKKTKRKRDLVGEILKNPSMEKLELYFLNETLQ